MANPIIKVSAVDNELYLVAINQDGESSYQLAHIQSGYNRTVDVTITLAPPVSKVYSYVEPPTYNGVGGKLSGIAYTVYLPSGSYDLFAAGVSWGHDMAFAFTLDVGSGPTAFGATHQTGLSSGASWALQPTLPAFTIAASA